MGKAIKLKNDIYLDSSAIVHNQKKLSDFLNGAYCQLAVSGTREIPSNVDTIITDFDNPVNFGGFEGDVNNGRLVIPAGTNAIETSGMICGLGYANAFLKIVDANGNQINKKNGILVQSYGNGYWEHSLPNTIFELDATKVHYIYLVVSGYNEVFKINRGFGTSCSFIQAKKIR